MEKKQQPDKICVQENDNREGRRSIKCVRGKKRGGGGGGGGGGARNMHVCGGRRVTMSFGERGVSVFFFNVLFYFIYLFIYSFFFFFFFLGGGGEECV